MPFESASSTTLTVPTTSPWFSTFRSPVLLGNLRHGSERASAPWTRVIVVIPPRMVARVSVIRELAGQCVSPAPQARQNLVHHSLHSTCAAAESLASTCSSHSEQRRRSPVRSSGLGLTSRASGAWAVTRGSGQDVGFGRVPHRAVAGGLDVEPVVEHEGSAERGADRRRGAATTIESTRIAAVGYVTRVVHVQPSARCRPARAPSPRSSSTACVFAVRRAWVPFSVERSQSQKPVSAASTETAAPPMKT